MAAIEYRDLLVAVWAGESPGFFCAKAEDEFGRATPTTRIYLPFDDRWFVHFADRLEEQNAKELHYVGARLFDSLFQGDILRLYVHLLEQVRNTGARLRVRLKLDPPMVARLPWECLYDTRARTFLGTSSDVTLVRYRQPRGADPSTVPGRPPLRVLLAVSAPSSPGADSRVSREARVVRQALTELESIGVVSVITAGADEPLTFESLDRVLSGSFDVIHLICGARWDGESARFLIGAEGISMEALARLLETASPRLLVWSGGPEAGVASPSLADRLLDSTPALLSQRHSMPEELLSIYTSAFYRALGALEPVDAALAEACGAVSSHFPADSEWVAPALYLSRKDGNLLHSAARGVVTDVYQISEGRYRRRLRESLNRFWPKPERYFPQLSRWIPRDEPLVGFAHAAEFLGHPQSAAELSRRFQRLLLIGGAGSGKSMALYRLFYEAAQPVLSYETKSPLPIYLSLPDLGDTRDLFEFLASDFDRGLFESDLEEGRFLFLLDSLDGLSAVGTSRRAETLNAFMRRYPLNRFVVTTRQPSPKPVEIPNWAEMLPFAEWEALEFLTTDDAIRPEPAKILYDQLARSHGADAGNPQILALARRLWREGARVPDSVTGIFEGFFRIAGASIAAETRDTLLPQLAFFMSKGDRLSLRREHLEGRQRPGGLAKLAHEIAFRSTGAMGADELLAEIEKTRLLRGPEAFTFPSLAFQEFLTAYSLRHTAVTTVLNLVAPADWRYLDGETTRPLNLSRGSFHGTLPFLCGLRDDGPGLVESLVGRDLVLASRCFRETRPATNVDSMLRAAVEREINGGDELQAAVAVLSLEARADGWAIDYLEHLATEPGRSVRVRVLALEALGNLCSIDSVPVLETAAEASDLHVVRAAMDALARIKVS
jgi:hypothetical protein